MLAGVLTRSAITALLLTVFLAQGCTSRAWYEGMKSGYDNHCALAPVSEYEACVSQHTDSYDEYQAKRDAVVAAGGDE